MRLILVTVLVFVAVGLATGGSLRNFPGERIPWGGVALTGVAAQSVVVRGPWAFGLLALSLFLLIAFAAADVRRPGWFVIATMRRHPAPAPAPERSVGAGGAP